MKLKSRQDPDNYITKLEKVKFQLFNTHKAPIYEEALIILVINGLPEEYDFLIDNFHQKMSIGNLNIDDCKEKLRAKYFRNQRWSKTETN